MRKIIMAKCVREREGGREKENPWVCVCERDGEGGGRQRDRRERERQRDITPSIPGTHLSVEEVRRISNGAGHTGGRSTQEFFRFLNFLLRCVCVLVCVYMCVCFHQVHSGCQFTLFGIREKKKNARWR